jgi:hypothetical protein
VAAVSLINLFSLGQSDQNRVAYQWGQLVNNLFAGQHLQVVIESNPLPAHEVLDATEALVTTPHETLRTIAGWSLERLKVDLERRHVPALSAYLVIGPAPEVKMGLTAGLEGIARAAGLGKRTKEPDRIALDTAVDDVLHQCMALDVTATRLRRADVLALLWRTINPGVPQPDDLATAEDLAYALAPARWCERYEGVQTNDVHTRSFYLLNIPEKTSPGSWLTDVMSLPCTLRVSWHIVGTDRFKERKRLLRKRRAAAGLLAAQARRGALLNLDTESEGYEAGVQAMALSDPTVGVARMSLVVTLQARDPAALAQAARRAAGLLRIRWSEEGAGHGRGMQKALWQASLPLAQNRARRRAKLARTEFVGNGYPFISHSPGMPRGVPVGYTVRGGELVTIDLSDDSMPNGVVSVVGKTNSGKTFLTQLMALWTLFKRGRVTIVDQGEGYKTLCDLIGGVYVAPAKEDAPKTINLWEYKSSEERRSKVDFLVAAHEIMLTRPGEHLSPRELSILDEAIRHVYAQHPAGSIPLQRELVAYLHTLGNDKRHTASERDLLRNMHATLTQYVGEGRYAHLIDRPTTVDVDASLLVFDLDKLPRHLYALMMLIIVDTASRRAETTHAQRGHVDVSSEMLVVDEGWFITRYTQAGFWLEQLARRARHIGLIFFFVTQQLSDLTDNETAATIFNASSLKCMFQQSDVRSSRGVDMIEWLATTLQISLDEARKLPTLPVGQMMLFRSLKGQRPRRGIVDVKASPLEYWIFTTEPNVDVPARRVAIAEAGGDTLQGVLALATASGRGRAR